MNSVSMARCASPPAVAASDSKSAAAAISVGGGFMRETLQLYWDILWRRRGPADLPYSLLLCAITAILPIALGVWIDRNVPEFTRIQVKVLEPGAPTVVLVLVVFLLEACGYVLLLRAFGHIERSLQTITAILGVSIFTGLAAAGLMVVGIELAAGASQPPPYILLALLAVGIYDVYIKGWIFAKASDRPVALCIGLLLALHLLVAIVGGGLLGPKVEPLAAGG
jgi:hypothetical protein